GFGSVPFTLTRPAGMTFLNAKAAYQMFAQFPTSTGLIRSSAALAVDVRYLCGNFNLPNGPYPLPTGVGLTPNLAVSNHGTSVASIPYRIRAIGPDMEPDQYSLRLNGLPPGEPVLGTLTVAPGGTTTLPCRVMFELSDPTTLYTILLEADLDGDGEYEPL